MSDASGANDSENSKTGGDDTRSFRIDQVLMAHLQQRLEGVEIEDADLVDQHVELMPELGERLRLFREIADQRNAIEGLETECMEETPDDATIDQSSPSDHHLGALRVRCPHCKNGIKLLFDAPLENIECSSCGSSFHLLSDDGLESRDLDSVKSIAHLDLISRLGMGSFGTVWKAHDTKLDRMVAVKIPRKGQLDPAREEQFLRVARGSSIEAP